MGGMWTRRNQPGNRARLRPPPCDHRPNHGSLAVRVARDNQPSIGIEARISQLACASVAASCQSRTIAPQLAPAPATQTERFRCIGFVRSPAYGIHTPFPPFLRCLFAILTRGQQSRGQVNGNKESSEKGNRSDTSRRKNPLSLSSYSD